MTAFPLVPTIDSVLGLLAIQTGGTFWLPPQSSSTAKYVDGAFYFILDLSIFFFFLIVALMVLFVVRYRRRPGFDPGESPNHNTPLEIFWSVIPLGLVIGIFYYSFIGYLWLRTAPRNPAYEIYVTGQKWTWSFKYPNGYVDPNLHVPVDESVKLTMQSQDVIHSLFIPAFRVKMDVVPGRYTTTWFKAIEVGEYDLECTEYCGTGHSDMLAKVIVHPSEDDYKNWLRKMDEDQQKLSPVDAGRAIVTRLCSVCHTVDGTAKIGPSFKGIWGEMHTFSNASPTLVDENYIRESILEPSKKIREGFPDRMPTFKGQLTDQQITNIIAYVKTLK
jgi:cytochrome c oxidase subunit 2